MRGSATTDQTAGLEAQERDLKAAGAETIFGEQSSSAAQRAKLAECLAFLREGDVLTVTKPDRLARSTAELLSIEADLTKRGIGLVVLSMGGERLDTRKPDQQADADDPGRRGDVGARDHAGAPARGHRQGEGRRQIQGAAAEHRQGADQDSCWSRWALRTSRGRWGSRGRRSTSCRPDQPPRVPTPRKLTSALPVSQRHILIRRRVGEFRYPPKAGPRPTRGPTALINAGW